MSTVDRPVGASEYRSGLLFAVGAYLLWGVLPAYFVLLDLSGPYEVTPWRVLFTLAFCVVLVAVTRAWRPILAILRQPRLMAALALSAALIYVNWQGFILASLTGHVLEVSLGYFINPLVSVLLGVIFLRERLRALQWTAVGVAFVGVVVLGIVYGTPPWLSMVLAFSFGFYGLVRNRLGSRVDTISGVTIETVLLVPVCVVQLVIVAGIGGLTLGHVSVLHTLAIAGAGVVTAVPLLLYGSAVRRLPLSVAGLIQFINPVIQFLVGAVLLGEPMPPARWLGFGIVWVAIALVVLDSLRQLRVSSRPGRPAAD